MRKLMFLFLFILITLSASCARKAPITSMDIEMGSNYATLDPEITDPGKVTPLNDDLLSPQEMRALKSEYAIRFPKDAYSQELIRDQFIFLNRDVNAKLKVWMRRAELYLPQAKQVFKERGLPEDLAYLAFIESGYNPQAVSRSGAAGCWQFMPFTGRRFGLHCDWWVDERRDPYASSMAAASYLSKLHDMFGDWSLAIAAYNAGEGKIGRAIAGCGAHNFFELHKRNSSLPDDLRLKEETLYYVPRFAAMVKIANNFELLGYGPMRFDQTPTLTQVDVKGGTDLTRLAQTSGMSWEDFSAHNPAFRRQGTPPDRTCPVYVPVNSVAAVRSFLSSSRSTLAVYQPYTVVRGDSWNRIANRFNTTVTILKQANNYHSNTLHPGQHIVVPNSAPQEIRLASAAPAPRPVETPQKRNYSSAYSQSNYSQVSVSASASGPYRVRQGDTLYSLAKRFGCSVNSLMRANNFATPSELMAGKEIRVPGQSNGPSTYALLPPKQTASRTPRKLQTHSAKYLVQNGDTLWSIARKFSVSPFNLLEWNDMNRHSVIQPGDKVVVYLD